MSAATPPADPADLGATPGDCPACDRDTEDLEDVPGYDDPVCGQCAREIAARTGGFHG